MQQITRARLNEAAIKHCRSMLKGASRTAAKTDYFNLASRLALANKLELQLKRLPQQQAVFCGARFSLVQQCDTLIIIGNKSISLDWRGLAARKPRLSLAFLAFQLPSQRLLRFALRAAKSDAEQISELPVALLDWRLQASRSFFRAPLRRACLQSN